MGADDQNAREGALRRPNQRPLVVPVKCRLNTMPKMAAVVGCVKTGVVWVAEGG